MTQSQTPLTFYSCTSIVAWAGTQLAFVFDADPDNPSMPYVEKDGLWYYFGLQAGAYRLLMTSTRNLED